MTILFITDEINKRAKNIIENIDEETVSVFVFLANVYAINDITNNFVFQFVFRSYYQFEKISLPPSFMSRYFQTMEQYRYRRNINPKEIAGHLQISEIPKQHEFSLVTKLINMVDTVYPIYNAHIDRVFQLLWKQEQPQERKLDEYLFEHQQRIRTYETIIEKNLLQDVIERFDEKFPIYDLPAVKKLDFIFSSYGKLLNEKSELSHFR